MINYSRVCAADFPLLGKWLAQPHVARWWNHETTAEAVERDFGPAARGEGRDEALLVHLAGTPVALVQRSWLCDAEEYRDELAAVTPVGDDAVTIDYLIGDPALTGRGLGADIIRLVSERTWIEHQGAQSIIVAVHVENRASWRALEKAGFDRVGTGDMTPDNPADSREHHVYRRDRPPDSAESGTARTRRVCRADATAAHGAPHPV